jgi:DNA-binding transcriptional regulator YhcF (GntR family)
VREAATVLRVTPNTAGKRFKELVDHGFLEATTKGSFSVKFQKATLWRITLYPSRGGKAATREYARTAIQRRAS